MPLILEYLEQRVLLAGDDLDHAAPATFIGFDGYEWTGMAVYGGFLFYAGGGGELVFNGPSITFGVMGLLCGYHVGAGIRDDWFGYGTFEEDGLLQEMASANNNLSYE